MKKTKHPPTPLAFCPACEVVTPRFTFDAGALPECVCCRRRLERPDPTPRVARITRAREALANQG
jgi:hypothetical protein